MNISEICKKNKIEITNKKEIIGSFSKKLYVINSNYLIRISSEDMNDEIKKIKTVNDLDFVPRILDYGKNYILLSLIEGIDLIEAYKKLAKEEIKNIGLDISVFYSNLHADPASLKRTGS